jgi:putative transposase
LPQGIYPPPGLRAGQAFVWIDRYLDTTRHGPKYLLREEIASAVLASLQRGVTLSHYELRAYVVMANHVHMLILPKIPVAHLLRSLKGVTAHEANRTLDRTGQPFWQSESYDHWVRDDREMERIVNYIENNPVKAGLVTRSEDYPFSSAFCADKSVDAAGKTACATARTRIAQQLHHRVDVSLPPYAAMKIPSLVPARARATVRPAPGLLQCPTSPALIPPAIPLELPRRPQPR